MGFDSRGVYRGRCAHPECPCMDFKGATGTSKCVACHHPPTSHPLSPQTHGAGRDKRTSPTPTAHHGVDRGAVSHTTASSGWHSSWESHGSQSQQHNHLPWGVVGGLSGKKACYSCGTVYSPVDLGACPKCCPREVCKKGCGKLAFCSLELGSFSYCSPECRDKCELERARREVASLVKGFEVNPGRDSSQAPAKESSVNHGAMLQPPTRCSPRGDDTPTTVDVTPGAPPTQQHPPQNQATMKYCNCKLTYGIVRAMSLYDSGRLQTVNGTKGMLVTSVEVNKDTLSCGVQPLDLITQLDGKQAESLGDPFGQCNLRSKILMTNGVADAWIARMSQIPSMSDLQGLVESHQSSRKYRIVGLLVTQKNLMDLASFLRVHMDRHSNGRKVDRVEVLSEADKAGLRENDIIQSVTLVTTDGEVHGPEAEWTFDSISRTAKSLPSVFALLMIVLNF